MLSIFIGEFVVAIENIVALEKDPERMPNPPEIEFAGSKAFYSPIADRITLPPRELFTSAQEFYASGIMRQRMPQVTRSDLIANLSPKPRRSVLLFTLPRNSLQRCRRPIYAPRRESRRRS